VAARRRGYTAEGFRQFVEQSGVSKSDGWIDYSVLEDCMRNHLNDTAPRRVAVLDPLKLVIENLDDGEVIECEAPNHPQKPELGRRRMPLTRELYIEREDFMAEPSKGFFRLQPGGRVRLKYGFVADYVSHSMGEDGQVSEVRVSLLKDSQSGTPGADNYKVKGVIHWVSASQAHWAEVRLFDRLFKVAAPGARREGDTPETERDFKDDLNPASLTVVRVPMEPSLQEACAEDRFQFERHGYFVADLVDSKPGAPVFNRTVTLKDSWAKA
ncbi:MAG: glutamine--tRNA ligase, partial [Burkholderiaceae bacterium]